MRIHSALSIASLLVLMATKDVLCFFCGHSPSLQSRKSVRIIKSQKCLESTADTSQSANDGIDVTTNNEVEIFDASSIGKLVTKNVIQLLPSKEPYVTIEEAPSNARRIFTGVDIMAEMESIWEVLTAFERLQDVVPSLVKNEVVFRTAEGGARLAQVGGAKVLPGVTFTAKTVLDVTVFTEENPMPDIMLLNRTEKMPLLVRGVFPRPDCISSLPHRDIAIQNVLGEGDFDHYQGVWRMQSLPNCAEPGCFASRLTYAVEIKPKGFLPVKLIEGRIATDLKANLAAIRDYVEKMTVRSAEGKEKDNNPSFVHLEAERGITEGVRTVYDNNSAITESLARPATDEEDIVFDFSINDMKSAPKAQESLETRGKMAIIEEFRRQQLVHENESFQRMVALLEQDLSIALRKIREIGDLSKSQLGREMA